MALNHLGFQGHMVDNPQCGQTSGGTDYANFRLAWNEKYRDKETKCFLECKAFGNTAQFIGKYFTKGSEMLAEGKLITEEWTNNEGQKRSKTVLMVGTVHFCGKKAEGTSAAEPAVPAPTPEDAGGELPF